MSKSLDSRGWCVGVMVKPPPVIGRPPVRVLVQVPAVPEPGAG